jgi:hypothetical protein
MGMDEQRFRPCGARCREGRADLAGLPGDEELDPQIPASGFALDLPVVLGPESRDPREPRQGVLEQLEPLARKLAGQVTEAGDVPARPGQARDQAALLGMTATKTTGTVVVAFFRASASSLEPTMTTSTFCPTRSLAALSISSPSRTAQRGTKT